MLKLTLVAGLTAALALSGVAQAQTKPAAKPGLIKLPPGTVARVNNQDISKAELLDLILKTGARETVQKLVQKAVIEQEARKVGVTITDAEIAPKVREEKQRIVSSMMGATGTPMTFAEITQKFGLTEAEVAWSVRIQALGRKTFAKTLEKEVQPLDSQIKVAHILLLTVAQPGPDGKVPTPEETKKKEDDAKAKLEEIVADIKAGKITFDAAARKFSDDKGSAADGGKLPWFSKTGIMVAEFENAAFSLAKPGDMSPIVKTQYGFHVLKLIQVGKSATAAEKKAYRDQELEKLASQPGRFQQWLGNAVQRANVTVSPITSLGGAAPVRK